MKFADRLKVTATIASTGVLNMGAAVTSCRTLAQALADTDNPLTAGDMNIAFVVDDGAGNWESGLYTITSSTQITRTQVLTGSAGAGVAVTFTGSPLTAYNTLSAFHMSHGLVNADDVGYDIILCAGQSNMCGRDAVDALIDMVDARVMQFGGASGDTRYRTIFSGANPIHNQEGVGTGKLSPQTWFASAYAASIPAHRRVLLVPVAYGGTSLVAPGVNGFTPAGWNASGGALAANAVSQANLAITEARKMFPNSRFVGVIWHQGESDGDNGVSQANYASGLTALISYFRANITGAANSWFVIGGMVPEVVAAIAGYPTIRLAHMQVAAAVSKCAYVDGIGGYKLDTYHYNAAGARILGARMALAARAAALSVGAVIPASALTVSVTPSAVVGSTVTISIGTDFPLTGAQTITAAIAETVTGSATATSVTLTASNNPVTINFTPTAPGSGNITATQTAGTPTVAAGTAPFTATASATAPGAPTIGAATAGDTTASFAFTAPASNGGAAIDAYRLTVYKASDNTVVGTFTGASSPIAATGLADGTGYYGKVEAHNSVGYGAQSAASNTVTPAAVATGTTFSTTDKAATWALSNSNLTATNSGAVAWSAIRCTTSKTSGKSYYEAIYSGSNRVTIGIGTSAATLNSFVGNDANGWGLINADGSLYNGSANVISGSPVSYTAGDVIGVALDADAHTVRFYKNGVAIGSAAATVTSTALFPMAASEGPDALTVNFGATAFAYAPPAGFTAWG